MTTLQAVTSRNRALSGRHYWSQLEVGAPDAEAAKPQGPYWEVT